MVRLSETGVYAVRGKEGYVKELTAGAKEAKEKGAAKTMAHQILETHNRSGEMEKLKIRFDSLTSHDITFVGIIQTAMASGLTEFPMPYALTNCHNSLCAVGGTINEDDHVFGLSCAKKFGGMYVPPHLAVIHQFAREMLAGCGKMVLGSDSHTRYGALGTMAVGEGGPELVKQLLGQTYDINCPEVIAVHLTGKPHPGVGPQDVALAIIGAVFEKGYVNNKIMEFVGEGIGNLSVDYRIGIDVMTTETTCLSSIWETDEAVRKFYQIHERSEEFKELHPADGAYYDGCVTVDLSKVEPMIAMPFHPSNVYTIAELQANPGDILREVEKKAEISLEGKVPYCLTDKIKNGKLYVEQGVIAGCGGGGYENLCAAADILRGHSIGADEFSLSVYPASQPIYLELVRNGRIADLMATGATIRTAFCGPCFGAGDVPANNGLSIRHSTRNFPNREGSKLTNGQIASVALMDARSIAATAANQGYLTAATELDVVYHTPAYRLDSSIYANRVNNGVGKADPSVPVKFGPNIVPWPELGELTEDILLKVVSEIHDPVTTTDELIPSGETSSYRSNPLGLAEFTLSRKDPAYVGEAKAVRTQEEKRKAGVSIQGTVYQEVFDKIKKVYPEVTPEETEIGSAIYAVKPGDGSAREQAASCQRVLGGLANIAMEYATKRYRSNLINWGMLPFLYKEEIPFHKGDYLFVRGVCSTVAEGKQELEALVIPAEGEAYTILLGLGEMTEEERTIIQKGCLINYNRRK